MNATEARRRTEKARVARPHETHVALLMAMIGREADSERTSVWVPLSHFCPRPNAATVAAIIGELRRKGFKAVEGLRGVREPACWPGFERRPRRLRAGWMEPGLEIWW